MFRYICDNQEKIKVAMKENAEREKERRAVGKDVEVDTSIRMFSLESFSSLVCSSGLPLKKIIIIMAPITGINLSMYIAR